MTERVATRVGEHLTRAVRAFFDQHRPATPCLVIDLDVVARRFGELRAAWQDARICYAVKANPAPEILRLLAGLGAEFDVAGPAEIASCLAEGVDPAALSYGNTIKKAADIAYAHARGVRRFTTDSHEDLRAIAAHAPGAEVFCRILVLPHTPSATPFGRKFGCAPAMALEILREAPRLGLRAAGVAFHVGSQQTDPAAWTEGIAPAARISERLGLAEVNIGGGFPVSYRSVPCRSAVPGPAEFAATIKDNLRRHFPAMPRVVLEPGRAIVAEAGVLRAEVVLVSRKADLDEHRWVYLDVGRYGGLAETEGEAITYRLVTAHDDGPHGPVVLAGPTCDGDDVIYQRSDYRLPLALAPGDHVDFLATGAYTASYSSIAFNGFPPLATFCVGEEVRT